MLHKYPYTGGKNNPDSFLQLRLPAIPRQDNWYDCGLFVLTYMDFFCHDAPDVMPTDFIASEYQPPFDHGLCVEKEHCFAVPVSASSPRLLLCTTASAKRFECTDVRQGMLTFFLRDSFILFAM